ncbi:GFA family protein [Erythrobacter rubeus]|uniref:GFA family protein n=1 Tax=Erythrobacter rubeus TaxID=2760803 RepID=A0ABR8KV32_9SPHN|nr:GFA family protein [Erythrobacter rubeus]MBD2843277.1 GFA family protein [Erythrobacter rubeus]
MLRRRSWPRSSRRRDLKAYRGHCRCGEVQLEVQGPPLLTAACHCEGCQRMTAGAFSLNALYREENFRLIAGETVLGGLKGPTRHFFCPSCLSWLFTKPDGLDGMVNIRTPMLERAQDFPPFAEFYGDEGIPGAKTGAPRHFANAPSADEFFGLTKEYASWQGRPG